MLFCAKLLLFGVVMGPEIRAPILFLKGQESSNTLLWTVFKICDYRQPDGEGHGCVYVVNYKRRCIPNEQV